MNSGKGVLDVDAVKVGCGGGEDPSTMSRIDLEKEASQNQHLNSIEMLMYVLEVLLLREESRVDRLLVVSNHVKQCEILHDAVNAHTKTVHLDYEQDTLETLLSKMQAAAGRWAGKLLSIGFMDHGSAGEFCLLQDTTVTVQQLETDEQLRAFWTGVAFIRRLYGCHCSVFTVS